MIAKIAPFSKLIDKDLLDYEIPENLKVEPGSIVKIPLLNRVVFGIIFELSEKKSDYKLKPIKGVYENIVLPKEYLKISRWLGQHYFCSLGQAISLFIPPLLARPRKKITEKVDKISPCIVLSKEQEKIYQNLSKKLEFKNKKTDLLYGVTGSGKTEIYIKLAQKVVEIGKKAVILVPEIMLTPQTIERFQKHFPGKVSLIHSRMSDSERFHAYRSYYLGETDIIIGPRLGLLVPNKDIGLIVIDEEQEDSYKQDQSPRYHSVDLAERIAQELDALLVLGTATPRVESYFKAKNGEYDLHILANRYHEMELPPASIIDLKDEIKKDNISPISTELQQRIQKILYQKKQILLFLNRRGTATFVSCRECGFIITCPNCQIPLVYHQRFGKSYLNCHHCDHRAMPPNRCPNCQSPKIKFFGAGTERIEAEAKRLFPEAKIELVDSTTIKTRSDYESFYQRLKNKEIDIVIGTQIIAKGLDIPNVDLVGVISADTGLHLPHFKASEKVFQLITQVSGRSGRKHNPGQTIIQTYWPESSAIQAASTHDFEKFYDEEIKNRQEFFDPPFSHLVRIISENPDRNKAKSEIEKLAEKLRNEKFEIIGPSSCFYQMMHHKYRFHLLVKVKNLPNEKLTSIWKECSNLVWDSDPVSLL